MTWTDALVGLVMLVGLVGIVVPLLPGTALVLGAALVWALLLGEPAGWAVFAVVATALAVGAVVKYLVPGRRLKTDGVPNRTLLAGALGALVGFFVIPVLGLFVGFVLGIYLAELARLGGHEAAWPSTKAALRAVLTSVLIELAAAVIAIAAWMTGVATT